MDSSSETDEPVREEGDIRQYYDAYYRKGDFFHYPENTDVAFFNAILTYFNIMRGSRYLDAGCGTGVRTRRLEQAGFSMLGVDLSMEGLRVCRRIEKDTPVVQANVQHLPFHDSAFDGVISLGCSIVNVRQLEPVAEMVRECLRVTRTGGWVLITTLTDFSGTVRGGWQQHTRGELSEILDSVPASERQLVYCAPGATVRFPRFHLHPLTSWVLQYLPHISRTVLLGWQK